MGDLAAALVRRTQALAQPRAADATTASRLYQVRITRPEDEPTYDRNRHALDRPEPELVYEGPASVSAVTPGGMLDLGDAPEYFADTQIGIGLGVTLEPRIDDIVKILDDDAGLARTANAENRRFRVVGVGGRGGILPTGFVLRGTGIEPSRETP